MAAAPDPVPQFIAKLFKLANAPPSLTYITWSEDDTQFWVSNVESFSRDVLPVYFKHNNYASFVRQLNMYGFHRSTDAKGKVEPGIALVERFSHPMFLRGREDLLINIHRKNTAAQKRIKTEEVDPFGFAATPAVLNFPPVRDTPPEVVQQMGQMLDAIHRLEGQNASLLAQAAQQQEVLNHLIHILARHSLLSETELPHQLPLAAMTRMDRILGGGSGAPGGGVAGGGVGGVGSPHGSVGGAGAGAGAGAGGMVVGKARGPHGASVGAGATPSDSGWSAESPPEGQVFEEEEEFASMLTSLDLPASFDPPILC